MNLSKSLTKASSIISEEKAELSASINSPSNSCANIMGPELPEHLVEELGADPRTLAANDLDPFNPFSVDPILVEVPAPAIRRRHVDLPALTDRQHRRNRRLHRVRDVRRLVRDHKLGGTVAAYSVGI